MSSKHNSEVDFITSKPRGKVLQFKELMHHLECGSQYIIKQAYQSYQSVLAQFHIQVSMCGKGDCHDNAMVENFFRLLKAKYVSRHVYQSC